MLISKFNLYKSEWLELVFDNRNKDYGAYYLRQHYAGNMVRAMGITFLGIGLLCGAVIILKSPPPTPITTTITEFHPTIPVIIPPVKAIKHIDPPAPVKPLRAQPAAPTIKIVQDIPPIVVPDALAKNPVKIDNSSAIGPINSDGIKTNGNDVPAVTPGTGTPTDDSIHPPIGLDVMPEPVGGMNAFSKFLSKNLRFPYEAQTEGVGGRVYLSFVIEKDGHLSNIVIDRAAGHGFDEEAMRVLKMAKAWKPGMQNGQPVRVKYSIPINFQYTPAD